MRRTALAGPALALAIACLIGLRPAPAGIAPAPDGVGATPAVAAGSAPVVREDASPAPPPGPLADRRDLEPGVSPAARPIAGRLDVALEAGEGRPPWVHLALHDRAGRVVAARLFPGGATSMVLDDLPPGPATLRATAGGLVAIAPVDVSIAPGATTRATLLAPPGLRLGGRVVDADRTPVAGVEVALWPDGAAPRAARSVATGDDGTFSIEHLDAGRYSLAVEGVWRPIDLASDRWIEIRLPPPDHEP